MEPQKVDLVISFGNTLRVAVASVPAALLGHSIMTITYEGFSITTRENAIMYTLPIDHFVKMQVAYVDMKGNPATVDGVVSWLSSDETIAIVTVDQQDSTIVTVSPLGPLGQVQITATADADLGEGVKQLITTCDISLVGGEAVAGTITPVGAPEPITQSSAKRK
jgi:hypothetical protein